MLQADNTPIESLLNRVCYEHALPDTAINGKPNPTVVNILVSPVPVPGFSPVVDSSYPLVAFVSTGCFDPKHNDKLPKDGPAWPCETFFVGSEYIGGRGGKDGHVQISCDTMLPWYEQAIAKYLLPDGWTMKDWVFTSPTGEEVVYTPRDAEAKTGGLVLYPDGTWKGESNTTDFSRAYRQVNNYVTEVTKGNPDRSKNDSITDKASALNALRNFIVPQDIEQTAISLVYGYGNNHGNGAKVKKQAVSAYLQQKLGVPIRLFEPVYGWPE